MPKYQSRIGRVARPSIHSQHLFLLHRDVNIQQQKQPMQDQQLQRRTLSKTFYRILLDKGLLPFPNE